MNFETICKDNPEVGKLFNEAKIELAGYGEYLDYESANGFQKKIMHQLRFVAASMRKPIGEMADEKLKLEALVIIQAFQQMFHRVEVKG